MQMEISVDISEIFLLELYFQIGPLSLLEMCFQLLLCSDDPSAISHHL